MSTKVQTPTTKTAARPANEQNNMSTTTKKFIGAVEDEWQLYSDCASDYVIGAPIGFGASSIVYAATYYPSSSNKPSGERNESAGIPCALKVLDLDSLPQKSLRLLQRETTLMSLSKHPNVLRVRGSWMDGHKLYIALRLMNKGSAADIMRYGWPGGMEEDVVRCILKQALKGLNYLHINGFIHRDVKAANLLIDDDGTVLLGDLGVAADLSEDISQVASTTKPYFVTATAALPQPQARPQAPGAGKRTVSFDGTSPGTHKPQIGKRKSFVGTPCWMSPELIEGKQYDSSSDIWSFGITAIELSQGRPPRSRESPQRVLLRTIQEEPPTLDREGGAFKYSRAFKDMVDCCLAKDPSKRPTAEELLQTPFFKGAKNKSYLINTILSKKDESFQLYFLPILSIPGILGPLSIHLRQAYIDGTHWKVSSPQRTKKE
ncbi:kinase-like protein [Agrocybe pediades]|nr:kinase-like protein [Agrocybe pediades]